MKHFEELWEEAEGVSNKLDVPSSPFDINFSIKSIKDNVSNISNIDSSSDEDKEKLESLIGDIIFHVANITRLKNINSYKCLLNTTEEYRLDTFDEGELEEETKDYLKK